MAHILEPRPYRGSPPQILALAPCGSFPHARTLQGWLCATLATFFLTGIDTGPARRYAGHSDLLKGNAQAALPQSAEPAPRQHQYGGRLPSPPSDVVCVSLSLKTSYYPPPSVGSQAGAR